MISHQTAYVFAGAALVLANELISQQPDSSEGLKTAIKARQQAGRILSSMTGDGLSFEGAMKKYKLDLVDFLEDFGDQLGHEICVELYKEART